MDRRRDAGLAAAELALRVEEIARRHAGVATAGALTLRPGIPTAVAGEAELLRRPAAPRGGPARRACSTRPARPPRRWRPSAAASSESEPIWRIEPIPFDPRLVAAARAACHEAAGSDRELVSGALHDAAEVARVLPAAMIFCPSTGGISHAKQEDTPEPDLAAAIDGLRHARRTGSLVECHQACPQPYDGGGLSGATRNRCSAIRSTRVPSGSHAWASRSRDPFRFVARGEPGAAVVEGEPDQLELELGIAGPPDRQHAEVVPQPGVDRVVVEGVAEVVEQRAAPAPPGAVEDVRRVAGDQIGARLL